MENYKDQLREDNIAFAIAVSNVCDHVESIVCLVKQ